MEDLSQARQRKLQQAVIKAALELAGFERVHAFVLPVAGTDPPLYVALGDLRTIVDTVQALQEDDGAADAGRK